MKPVLVLYATREGHTRKIAEHITATLRSRRIAADSHDAASLPPRFSLETYGAAILAASLHAGHHEREMVAFVRHHRAELEAMPTAFVSASLTEVTVESATATDEMRADAERAVHDTTERFFADTRWRPQRAKAVAGALLYTRYNVLIRFVMKRIAKAAGGGTDTTRDYDYTDWPGLERFTDELIAAFGLGEREAAGATA